MNCRVAEILANFLGYEKYAVADIPPISEHNTIIFVIPNTGDEEIAQPMEDFLYDLKIRAKRYHICELGNHLGMDNYIGCKKAVIQILNGLDWVRISDVSVDSMPTLDTDQLYKWLLKSF